MTQRFGFYADLRSIVLDENGRGWIQAMRVGDYVHPRYGKLSFTPDRLMRFADSVKSKVRGIEPDVDYDHKLDPTKGREAAGWVKDAKVENSALWLLVDWTKTAVGKIREGAYRYFSPEFQDKWTDAAGKEHVDVLFGGGITNRPFLKDLLPLNLSELSFADNPKKEEGVDPKKLRANLGLPEDASEEQVLERATSLRQQSVTPGGAPVDHTATTHAPNTPATQTTTVGGVPNDATTAAQRVDKDGKPIVEDVPKDLDKQLSELAATNPVIAKLLSDQAAQQKQLAELMQENKKNAVAVKLSEYKTGNQILSPAVLTEAEKLLTVLPTQLHELVTNMLDKVKSGDGTVQLGETVGAGVQTSRRTDGKKAEDVVEERTKKLMTENKDMDRSDALMQVFEDDPKLFTEYQNDSYSFKV